jgi:hypothetical protein
VQTNLVVDHHMNRATHCVVGQIHHALHRIPHSALTQQAETNHRLVHHALSSEGRVAMQQHPVAQFTFRFYNRRKSSRENFAAGFVVPASTQGM